MTADQRQLMLVVAVVIVLVLIIVYVAAKQPDWGHLDYWKTHYVEDPDKIYARSAGVFDGAAELALARSEARAQPTIADHLRAATIIHRNILSNEDRDPANHATRRNMYGRARNHYLGALTGLTDMTIAQDEAARTVRRFGLDGGGEDGAPPRGEIEGRPGAEYVIDAALDFAFGGGDLVFGDGIFDAGEPPQPDVLIATTALGRRGAAIEARQAAAAEVAENKGPGVQAAAFLELSQRHTSDSQNSHDPSVNAAKRAIVERLRADQGDQARLPTLDQIAEEIRQESASLSRDPRTGLERPVLTGKAVSVVKRAAGGERSLSTNASDREVLQRVWARADDPRNSEARGLIRQAVFDALVDSVEWGIGDSAMKCVDGRISRVLGALSLLDCDEENWNMARLEEHKNEIFVETNRLIKAAATDAAEQEEDSALRNVGRFYLASTPGELSKIGDIDEARENEWLDATREKIGRSLDEFIGELNRKTPGTIPSHSVQSIKAEALAALN